MVHISPAIITGAERKLVLQGARAGPGLSLFSNPRSFLTEGGGGGGHPRQNRKWSWSSFGVAGDGWGPHGDGLSGVPGATSRLVVPRIIFVVNHRRPTAGDLFPLLLTIATIVPNELSTGMLCGVVEGVEGPELLPGLSPTGSLWKTPRARATLARRQKTTS